MAEYDPKRVAIGRLVSYLLRAGWKPPPPDEVIVEKIMDDLARVHPLDRQPGSAGMLLTPMQAKVLQEVAEGKSNEEIAVELGIQVTTVRHHLGEIYPRLGANGRAHAVAIALSLGEIYERGTR